MAAVPALRTTPSAPPCRDCPQCLRNSSDCEFDAHYKDEYFFKVNGTKVQISYTGQYFRVKCTEGVQLHDALPGFSKPRAVNQVILQNCDAPNYPYAAVLSALGLRTPENLELKLTKNATLIEEAFVGMQDVKILSIEGAEARPGRLAPAALVTLELKALILRFVSANGLQLPPSLVALTLHGDGLGALAATALPALPALRDLTLVDKQLVTPPPLAAAKSLKNVNLYANRAASPIDLGTVQNLTLIAPRNISALQHCDSLVYLNLNHPPWLPSAVGARCPALTSLKVTCMPRTVLPTNLLGGAAALRNLAIMRCRLARVEHDFLKPAPNVRFLDLNRNKITTIDGDAFTALNHLEEVTLSNNLLREGAADAVLRAMPDTLRVLKLGGNRQLGDLCPPRGLSPLIDAKLQELSLPSTGATRICKDYNDNRYLHSVDLSDNKIAILNYTNVKWARRADSRPVELNLSGNPVKTVKLPHADYERLRAAGPAPAATVEVRLSDASLDCDCDTLWLKLALSQSLLRARFAPPLGCRRPKALLAVVDEKALVCEAKEYCVGATGCSCVVRVEAGAAPRVVAVAQCARAGLAAAPTMPPRPPAVTLELNLTDNSIGGLTASDLPEGLSVLDLRGNNVSRVEEAALAALRARGARLLLARNPLSCGCEPVAALFKHRTQVSDYELVTCDDGRPLSEVAAEAMRCGGDRDSGGNGTASWAALGAALAAAALLACGAVVAARSPARVKVMEFLEARGFCVRWASRDDDDDRRYLYDVFLSFSHHDVEFAEQLADRLESGPRPLRLCLHYRDWRAGDWIPAQIARSVAVSRRTVVLLSDHFLASGWARAEFREAYARAIQDSRPRLVVILLGASPPAGLDSEMRHYVTTNTYVRWGETGFWDKLRLALPEPRAAPALPASTAQALSAPTGQTLPAPIPQALPSNDTKKPAQLALEPAIQTSPCA